MPSLKSKTQRTFVDFDLDDGSPTDLILRRDYVARSAGFYQDILKKLLESQISNQYKELANPANTTEKDLLIKANINAFSLMMDWGDSMISEHMQNMSDPTPEIGP